MPQKLEKFQCLSMNYGERDRRFRHRDRRFRSTGQNRSRSAEISGHVQPKRSVTVRRNGWSRSAEIRSIVVDAIQEELAEPSYFVVIQRLVEIIHLIRHLMLNATPWQQCVDRAGIGTSVDLVVMSTPVGG
jgi:hypothetical protein